MSRRSMPAILRKRWGFPGIGWLPTFWHLWSTLELSWCLWVCHLACWWVKMNIYWGSAAAKSLQLCLTLCDPVDGSPPGSLIPGIPGKNTGVGCHFLLQCMKVKSESEVAQSWPTLCDPMDCSPPGSSVHGIFQARVLEWGAIAFSAAKDSQMKQS